MKPIISNLFVVTCFVGLCVQNAFSLKCYECDDSDINSVCNNKLTSSMIKTCLVEETACLTKKVEFAGIIATKRSCFSQNAGVDYKDDHNDVDDAEEEHNVKYDSDVNLDEVNNAHVEKPRNSVTVCDSDLCNGAVDNPYTKIILFISAMLSLSFCGYD